MIAVSVVGFKNSGKTTQALALCRELAARGLKVAAAKLSHHDLDAPHTDTARLAEVCDAVIGLGADRSLVSWAQKRYLPDLLPLISADVLVVEGGKRLGWLPRLLLLREADEAEALAPELALGTVGAVSLPGLPHFDNAPSAADAVLERGFALPGLDCESCGRATCRELAADIVARKTSPDACKASRSGVNVTVNGHPLALGGFVESLVAATLTGMLSQLKGYAPGKVQITLDT